jgi:hypothetical protein
MGNRNQLTRFLSGISPERYCIFYSASHQAIPDRRKTCQDFKALFLLSLRNISSVRRIISFMRRIISSVRRNISSMRRNISSVRRNISSVRRNISSAPMMIQMILLINTFNLNRNLNNKLLIKLNK